jgi:hypothetical protein
MTSSRSSTGSLTATLCPPSDCPNLPERVSGAQSARRLSPRVSRREHLGDRGPLLTWPGSGPPSSDRHPDWDVRGMLHSPPGTGPDAKPSSAPVLHRSRPAVGVRCQLQSIRADRIRGGHLVEDQPSHCPSLQRILPRQRPFSQPHCLRDQHSRDQHSVGGPAGWRHPRLGQRSQCSLAKKRARPA